MGSRSPIEAFEGRRREDDMIRASLGESWPNQRRMDSRFHGNDIVLLRL